MSLSRRSLTLGLIAASFAGGGVAGGALAQTALSAEDRALVARATAYLQALTEARAQFVQLDGRGQQSRGELFLKRPGKARFAYAPPSGLLVVSDGSAVSVADSRLKTFDKYPLVATPLSLFLARNIRLDQGVTVTRVTRTPGGFTIAARDGKKQTAGQLILAFSDAPLALTGWTVTDAQGRATQVRLSGLQRTAGLDSSLFVLKDPRRMTPGRAKM